MGSEPILRIRDVSVRFGGIVALDRRVVRCRCRGDLRPDRPEWRRQNDAVQLPEPSLRPDRKGKYCSAACHCCAHAPNDIAGWESARTFQNLALFHSLSVRQNVLAGAHAQRRTALFLTQ